jgi:hypothetical protein
MNTTENQSIIGKKKMRKSSITNFATFQQTPTNSCRNHTALKASITKTNNRGGRGFFASAHGNY